MDWEKLLNDVKENAVDWIKDYGPNVLAALAIYILGKWVAKIVRGIVRKGLLRAKMDPTLTGFLVNIIYAALMIVVLVAALKPLGVEATSFVAIIGAASFAVAFALQGSLSNFAAGVMIIMFRPFKIGDFIEGGGVSGAVQEIAIFSTIMKTPDNKRIIIPNSSLMGSNITNYSANPTRRVDLVFGIGYGDDLLKAKQILERIVADHALVLKDPAPTVAVGALADSSVNFNVRPWCRTADYWAVFTQVTEAVKLEFDKHGISIPFPQRDVHLHTVPADAA